MTPSGLDREPSFPVSRTIWDYAAQIDRDAPDYAQLVSFQKARRLTVWLASRRGATTARLVAGSRVPGVPVGAAVRPVDGRLGVPGTPAPATTDGALERHTAPRAGCPVGGAAMPGPDVADPGAWTR